MENTFFRIDKFGRGALFAGMGKRSPHEATCPRIASGSHQGRIMSAGLPILPENFADSRAPLAGVRAKLCIGGLP